MAKDKGKAKNQAAQAMVARRWGKTTAADRSEYARGLAAARWAGHVAKRPSKPKAAPKPAKKKRP
jgi:hypothetical protein